MILALVGALALPAAVLSSGAMFESAASDAITIEIFGQQDPNAVGVYVSAEGILDDDSLPAFSAATEDRLSTIKGLGSAQRILITEDLRLFRPQPGGPDNSADAADAADATDPGRIDPDDPLPGVSGRLFSAPGAVENLQPVAGSLGRPGLWISETLAADTELGVGDSIQVGAGSVPVPVAGVYADLWTDEPNDYWSGVPTVYRPRFLHVFNEPNFELVIVDESLMRELAPLGRVAWHVPLETPPSSLAESARLAGQYRAFERSFIRDETMSERYREFVFDPALSPIFLTSLADVGTEIRSVVAILEQPIRTATLAGTAAGVLLSTMGAVFMIRRRNTEYRLLAADGDGHLRFFLRAAVQFALPSAVAVAVGSLLGLVFVRLFGPTGEATLAAVPWSTIAVVTLGACVAGAAVTAVLAVPLADGMTTQAGQVPKTWLYLLMGAAVAMWIQVGRQDAGDVNPLVVAFPFVGIVAGVAAAVAALRLALAKLRLTGRRLPLPLFLAWRALTASQTGALLLAGALGVATGVAVLSSVFVTTIESAVEAKAATVVGGASRASSLQASDAPLPPRTTVIHRKGTGVDDEGVDVLAIEPSTFADAVTWPDEFGSNPEELIRLLGSETPGSIPAAVVNDRGLPVRGEFGLNRLFPYQVVATFDSAPLASTFRPTLVVRADVFEAFARNRYDAGLEAVDEVEATVARTLGRELVYESPLDSYGRNAVSQLPLDELLAALDAQGRRYNEVSSAAAYRNSVSSQATRWAYDYLRVVAVIGALAALGALGLFLSERHRERVLAIVIAGQIGVRPRSLTIAGVVELVGLVLGATAAGTAAAMITGRRVFPAFEPEPGTPPTVGLVNDLTPAVTVTAVLLALVAGLTVVSQRAAASASKSRALNHG